MPFPALTPPFKFIFLSNLSEHFIAVADKLLTNPSKLSLVKGTATFFNAKLSSQQRKDPPD